MAENQYTRRLTHMDQLRCQSSISLVTQPSYVVSSLDFDNYMICDFKHLNKLSIQSENPIKIDINCIFNEVCHFILDSPFEGYYNLHKILECFPNIEIIEIEEESHFSRFKYGANVFGQLRRKLS